MHYSSNSKRSSSFGRFPWLAVLGVLVVLFIVVFAVWKPFSPRNTTAESTNGSGSETTAGLNTSAQQIPFVSDGVSRALIGSYDFASTTRAAI